MTKTTQPKWRLTRRQFLIGTGVLGGGAALGYFFGLPAVNLKMAELLDSGAGRPASGLPTEPSLWIQVAPDNQVTFYIPKIEMGQGVHTALAQIMAEELGADWKDVRVVQADTARGPIDTAGTTGSTSVSSMWQILREVAAALREMLRTEAARQLSRPAADLAIQNGIFYAGGLRALSFGEVVTAKRGAWEAPAQKPVLKAAVDFTIVGQPKARVDLPDKVVGQAIYGYDARLPGMLYGAVAQPPSIGATLSHASPGSAAGKPGVVKIVIDKDFAGVAAESRQSARAALAALDLTWEQAKLWSQAEIEAMLEIDRGQGTVIQKEGNGIGSLSGTVIEAQYASPFAAHAHLEPQAALADVQTGKTRVWVSTQMPSLTRSAVAQALGVKDDQVEIMPAYLGGGFGRKYGSDVAVAAARLSAAAGKPVHVGWNREEEFQNGYLRPATRHWLQATLAADGRVDTLAHWQTSGEVAAAFLPGYLTAIMGDFGAWRGARIHYGIPNRFTSTRTLKLPVRTSWWRGLGLLANTFAVESFVDELAAAAKADPLTFRLSHLPPGVEGERLRKVLTTVADRSGWHTPPAAGRARGLACCSDGGTLCAQVAEVSVEAGQIHVHTVTCAIDPGLIVNPDGVTAQSEGAITMGLSSTLIEEVYIENGRVQADNFDKYPLITMADAPRIEVALIQSGDTPHGVGEPPIGPIAAAVANAVFALTGQRLRRLPLRLA
jgi:isoquinoline 1-oxidoreductase beta subunit